VLTSCLPACLPACLQGDTVEQLLPLFLSLLKDEWPDVRLAIIGKLQAVNQVGGQVI
jgi:serine/threonine-protein phosphatase 2A regulatory subunit A